MTTLAVALIAIPVALGLYSLVLYPLVLAVLPATGRKRPAGDPRGWPEVTITLPVYNEERTVGAAIESLLSLDYPADRRHILVISDASSDRTDAIVQSYAGQGVELVRLPTRSGKTAAENAAFDYVRGEIVINTDATTRIAPGGLRALVRAFEDPTVGVASGRDVSTGAQGTEANRGESGYVGYEMWVRDLEMRLGTIVGASGCFYALRKDLFRELVPMALSRDFASPLIAREHGYRSVSVRDAICYVPRAGLLRTELARKTRTMARGLETLWYKRALLNPFAHGRFAWMLASHKLARWLVFLSMPLAVAGLAWLSLSSAAALVILVVGAVLFVVGTAVAYGWPVSVRIPGPLAMLGFMAGTQIAALRAWGKALRGELNPIWEPTRRP